MCISGAYSFYFNNNKENLEHLGAGWDVRVPELLGPHVDSVNSDGCQVSQGKLFDHVGEKFPT